MPKADDLLTRWPALDVSARAAQLQDTLRVFPGTLAEIMAANAEAVGSAATRLWRRDLPLWSDDAAVQQKIANRLGWLSSPALMADSLERLRTFAAGIK